MAFCIPKTQKEALLKALKEGEVSVDSLHRMTSEERRKIFRRFVGSDFDGFVNAEFEKALRSNQKKAMVNWVEKVTKPKEVARKNMIDRIERNEKFLNADEELGFLEDLARDKLGVSVSESEARHLLGLKQQVDELKRAIPENSPKNSAERNAYGWAQRDYIRNIEDLKVQADAISPLERLKPENYSRNVFDLAGTLKSFAATFDNSFLGRQGIKMLMGGRFRTWSAGALDSFRVMGKNLFAKRPELFGKRDTAALEGIRAEIAGRPNALNGKYRAAANEYGLNVSKEEAFPTDIPERIPVLGRIFRASMDAFQASSLRMRADFADALIATAEKNGVDMLDPAQANAFGKIVSATTGRGEIGKLGTIGRELNAAVFSVRFLKSNIDTLTAHQFDRTMTPEARKAAAFNTLRILGGMGGVLGAATLMNPDSVEWNPRSANFGKINVGNTRIDISGGMGGLVTLASRLTPTKHRGEWGFWSKSATTGKMTKLSGENFGERSALDVFDSFWQGKLSPLAGVFRDVWRGQNFSGEKPGVVNTTIGLVTPISVGVVLEELERGDSNLLMVSIAEALGLSPTPTTFGGYGNRWQELKENQDSETYNNALREVTDKFNQRAERLENSARWGRLSNEEQANELTAIQRQVTDEVLSRFGI